MISVTRKAVAGLPSWPLVEPPDLFTALTELKDHGWDGAIDSSTWCIRLSSSGKQTVNACLGQWLVLDGSLRVISPSEFDGSYDSSEPVTFPDPEPVEESEPDVVPEPQLSADTSVPIVR